jgi:EmrB/QacA subfamily drug resistance transporter
MLVAARAFQGLGGAVLSPATLTIVTTTFTEPRERARALGLWSAALASGGATGALIGGILTDYLSWRWIFLINLPIGLAGFVATRAVLPESRGELSSRSLDIAGALTITGGLTALVFGVVRTETYGWTAPTTLVSLAVAAVLVAVFIVIETRIARSPLAPLGLFRSRALTGANLAMLCVGGSMFAMWYFVSLYLQGPLGMDPLHGGLAFLPASVAVIVGAQLSGRLVPRTGARPLLAVAALLLCGGLIWMSRLDAGGGYTSDILGPLIVVAFGLGLSFPPGTYAATAGVPPRDAGLASGIVNSTRQLGGAVGLAALATVAADRTSSLLAGAPRHPPSFINHALAAGYSRAFEVAAVIALGACVAALSIPGRVRARAAQPATPAPTAPGD